MSAVVMVAAAAAAGPSVLEIAYVVIGISTIIGAVVGVYRWAKSKGVKEDEVKRMADVVLPFDHTRGTLSERLDAQDKELAAIRKELKPNGGNTDALGDMVLRMETKLNDMNLKLVSHIAVVQSANIDINRRLVRLEQMEDDAIVERKRVSKALNP